MPHREDWSAWALPGLLHASVNVCFSTDPGLKIIAVHKILDQDRRAIYTLKKQQLRRKRGAEGVNEQWLFHGSALSGVVGIACNGPVLRPRNAEQFGVGMYFSPSQVAHKTGAPMMALQAQYSSPDQAGVQHMLLCRVLCGRQEKLKDGGAKGSSQFEPSSEEFDSGIDEPRSPHRVLMWGATLSTHVLPEFVVSFRILTEDIRDPKDGVDESLTGEEEKGRGDVGRAGEGAGGGGGGGGHAAGGAGGSGRAGEGGSSGAGGSAAAAAERRWRQGQLAV